MIQKPYVNFFLCLLIFVLFELIGGSVSSAKDLTSSNFILRDPVIGSGGGYGASGSFQMFQSLDSVLIGVNASASFIGHYGFLYFQGASGSPTPTPTPTPGGGGGGGLIVVTGCSTIPADFNCDGRVDILDFSILLFYVDKTGSRIIPYDLNRDGNIDLKDISILFYYWTA